MPAISGLMFGAGFGLISRLWSVKLQQRPVFLPNFRFMAAYPIWVITGAAIGHWLESLDKRAEKLAVASREQLLAKRERMIDRGLLTLYEADQKP